MIDPGQAGYYGIQIFVEVPIKLFIQLRIPGFLSVPEVVMAITPISSSSQTFERFLTPAMQLTAGGAKTDLQRNAAKGCET